MINRAGRNMGLILCATLAVAIAGIQIWTSVESKAVATGQHVVVIDGDTLQVEGKIVQLYGIDAPELGQMCLHDSTLEHCGLAAAFELKKLLSIEHVVLECRPATADPSLQICSAGHIDIARVLLESGYALATDETSESNIEAQDSAMQAKMGLWHSTYIKPADWRAGQRLAEETEAVGPCPVKAVVAPDGRRLYYVPTDKNYDSVEVSSAKGGRRYCNDEDARRDGWRREGQLGG